MVWVPIALSRDVPKNTARTVQLEGRKLVVRREHRTIEVHEDSAAGTDYAATETGGMVWINRVGMTEPPPVFLAGLSIVSLAIQSDLPTVLRLLGNPPPHADAQLVEVKSRRRKFDGRLARPRHGQDRAPRHHNRPPQCGIPRAARTAWAARRGGTNPRRFLNPLPLCGGESDFLGLALC